MCVNRLAPPGRAFIHGNFTPVLQGVLREYLSARCPHDDKGSVFCEREATRAGVYYAVLRHPHRFRVAP
jgi:hypothetical protein